MTWLSLPWRTRSCVNPNQIDVFLCCTMYIIVVLSFTPFQEMWSQERCQPWHRDAVTWAQVHHLARHDNALKYNSFRPAVPQFLPLILHHTLQLCRSRWPWLVLPKINLLLFLNRWATCHSPTPKMEVNCILPTWEFLRTCTKR